MEFEDTSEGARKVSVLIVDDSLVFRRFLSDIFAEFKNIRIVGEAQNGIEALDMVLKTSPDVILLDMEMPLMDGMTALQHLMIHRPIPTIMFSSLTEEGTARCFDTLKNGAVDFVSKDFIFQKNLLTEHKKQLLEKVYKAAALKMTARDPISSTPPPKVSPVTEVLQRVVFCEECGSREVVTLNPGQVAQTTTCSQCGDVIEVAGFTHEQYRRNSFISVLGGGKGCFANLLSIIPQMQPDMGGAVLVIIHEEVESVDNFTEYLNAISAMKVVRVQEGMSIEGGSCYVFSGEDYMSIKPYSAQMTLQRVEKGSVKGGPIDIVMASVGTLFKTKASAIILSGDVTDGDKGMAIMLKYGGGFGVLDPSECYCKKLSQHILSSLDITQTLTLAAISERIKKNHYEGKYDGVAGGL
ncbi:chemotaxis protein CheB [Desulforhopalus sp. IMCC35007]|uniref:chemotaxis protein CheB n=1 Tax=Desulforhopalus sp. IMCC35007 TaxID=2569543 RepID=UPI0010AE1F71|nr:chemotaxis protein CheB [Desulforhopalus sp. IMCC35007]TKB11179.1 chemotaxis protein CheB [Desulforhopalus sp. IMCC35007]